MAQWDQAPTPTPERRQRRRERRQAADNTLSAARSQHEHSFHFDVQGADMNEIIGDAISWFEIPVRDLQRAQRFYETVLERSLQRETIGDEQLAVFPAGEGRAKGCLMLPSQPIEPSSAGTRVYLDASPSLDAA